MIQIDMPMPDGCFECRFETKRGFCKAMPDNFCGYTNDEGRPEWCPLKEQEAVKPTYEDFFGNRIARCGKCNGYIVRYKYCPGCGQEVKWDD